MYKRGGPRSDSTLVCAGVDTTTLKEASNLKSIRLLMHTHIRTLYTPTTSQGACVKSCRHNSHHDPSPKTAPGSTLYPTLLSHKLAAAVKAQGCICALLAPTVLLMPYDCSCPLTPSKKTATVFLDRAAVIMTGRCPNAQQKDAKTKHTCRTTPCRHTYRHTLSAPLPSISLGSTLAHAQVPCLRVAHSHCT